MTKKGDKTVIASIEELKSQEQGQKKAYLIVISGRSVGKMVEIGDAKCIIGRTPDVDVMIDDEGVSRQHAMVMREGSDAVRITDLGSTNGVFFDGRRITSEMLRDGDKVQIGSSTVLKITFQDNIEEAFQKKLYESATRDGLTGVFNKKYFIEQLAAEFSFCVRRGVPLSLIIFDIDFFKKTNDTYGHLAGDYVLKSLAQTVTKTIRNEDIFARYGGEEFVILLRDTELKKAHNIAERIRKLVEAAEFIFEGTKIPTTISVGVASIEDENFLDHDELIRKADEYLYTAKRSGRNQVVSVISRLFENTPPVK
ncbi:MAG: GGDEF domain-containing protein [Myxococcota bacterium]